MPRAYLPKQKFGRWTPTALFWQTGQRRGENIWLCVCDCGTIRTIIPQNIRRGRSRSCGCWQRDNPSHLIHGASRRGNHLPEYNVWRTMKGRCLNPKNEDYYLYGKRGITICKRWRDYRNFIADMGPRPSHHHSIDRIDNDGDYKPSNCKWSTPKEQNSNKRAWGTADK